LTCCQETTLEKRSGEKYERKKKSSRTREPRRPIKIECKTGGGVIYYYRDCEIDKETDKQTATEKSKSLETGSFGVLALK